MTKPLNATTAQTLERLAKSTDDLELNYNATVYGDAAEGTEETLTTSPEHDAIYFGPGCLCADPAKCFPAGHPYHPYTNFGLDTLVRSYVEELRLLMLDPPEQHTVNNTHFNYVWAVGKGDLHDGLQRLLTLTEEDTLTDSEQAKTLQIAMLVVAFAMNVFFFARFFMPWLNRTLVESKRVAALLSELPPEMNIIDVIRDTVLEERAGGGSAAAALPGAAGSGKVCAAGR